MASINSLVPFAATAGKDHNNKILTFLNFQILTNLSGLRDFIQKTPPPISQKRERTFLDISGFPHYELVISNWYAYFLSNTEDHGLGNKLLASLLELINEKSGLQFSLDEYDVATEVSTKNLKRIDILLAGIGMDTGKYLILENKVYHRLHNDLKEYWDHCPTHESKKIGIVLTPHANNNRSFFNKRIHKYPS